jgi:4-hydroxy-3-methylbut-2-enyl diphosphate reductase
MHRKTFTWMNETGVDKQQVAQEVAGSPALRLDSIHDLTPQMFVGKQRVAITSGASTPSQVTREVIRFVEELGKEPSMK